MNTAYIPSQTIPEERPYSIRSLAIRTHAEIAEIFGCTESNVQKIEEAALNKLRQHPLLRRLWQEVGGTPEEMTHVWIGRRLLPERNGQLCRILVARRGKFMLEFADGKRVATVRGTFRKLSRANGTGSG